MKRLALAAIFVVLGIVISIIGLIEWQVPTQISYDVVGSTKSKNLLSVRGAVVRDEVRTWEVDLREVLGASTIAKAHNVWVSGEFAISQELWRADFWVLGENIYKKLNLPGDIPSEAEAYVHIKPTGKRSRYATVFDFSFYAISDGEWLTDMKLYFMVDNYFTGIPRADVYILADVYWNALYTEYKTEYKSQRYSILTLPGIILIGVGIGSIIRQEGSQKKEEKG